MQGADYFLVPLPLRPQQALEQFLQPKQLTSQLRELPSRLAGPNHLTRKGGFGASQQTGALMNPRDQCYVDICENLYVYIYMCVCMYNIYIYRGYEAIGSLLLGVQLLLIIVAS